MKKTKILLVEDHLIVRESIRQALEAVENFTVVGEAGNGEEALHMAKAHHPDVVIMDISMPRINGIEATRQIKAYNPDIIVIVLTAYDYEQYIFPLIEAGAAGYLLKDVSGAELINAIQTVSRGEAVLHPAVARKVMEKFKHGKTEQSSEHDKNILTEREANIIKMAAKGMSNNEIAEHLHLSVRTIESHLGTIFNKLGVGSRMEAVIEALRCGWFTIDDLSRPIDDK